MAGRNSFSNFDRIGSSVTAYWRSIDRPLALATVALAVVGVLNLWGIGGSGNPIVQRQMLFVVLGIGIMVLFSFVNWRYLRNWSLPVMLVYGAAILLLSLTLLSPAVRGIRAWIVLGGFRLEPSELAKLALVILLAKYYSRRHSQMRNFRHVVVTGLYTAVPMGIVLVQPDLGSAAILGIIWFVMLLAVGISRKHLFALIAVALVGAYLSWVYALAPYQQDRILAFIDPYKDPSGYGYHIIQSQIAIGSGHLIGQGLGGGSQAQMGFLPEPYNDFAFAAFAEQFGLFGVLGILSLSGLVVYRILYVGQRTSSNFAKLFCVGIATILFAHVSVSGAVNLGLMPITGLPFSFLSHGGSHLFSIMIGIGTVQSMKRYG